MESISGKYYIVRVSADDMHNFENLYSSAKGANNLKREPVETIGGKDKAFSLSDGTGAHTGARRVAKNIVVSHRKVKLEYFTCNPDLSAARYILEKFGVWQTSRGVNFQ